MPMLSQAQREEICCHVINHFLFERVWNETQSEYRINIKPLLMKKGSSVGSFSLLDATILLPTTTDSYYVWSISVETFNIGLKLPNDIWVNCADIANEYNTLLQFYSVSGSMLHKQYVYLKYNLSRTVIFIAARKDMVRACIPTMNEVNEDIYLTVYYDSDRSIANDVRVFSAEKTYSTTTNNFRKQIDTILNSSPRDCCLQIYKNGVEVTPLKYNLTFTDGDFIDIIVDENIAFSADIDITYDNQNPSFLSIKDSTWKQLIHIPKELNPDNKIITHNTCDFWVRRTLSSTPYGKYLHRVKLDDNSRDVVSQVTHNDMAIPLYVLDAYRDYLQAEEITIHLVARIHDKDNVLIRDASFIDLLYVHDDDQIIDILRGNGPENIPWWRADNLEQSKYVEMMFDVPNIVTVNNVKEYVHALGFYQVANLLCKRVIDVTATDGFKRSLTFKLPLLYFGYTVLPVVYLNGKVLNKDKFSYIVDTTTNECTVTCDEDVNVQPGDKLVYVFYLDGDKTIYSFTATEENTSIIIPFEEFTVWVEDTVADTHSHGNLYTKEYHQLAEINQYILISRDDGTYQLTVAPEYVGKRILIQNKYCSYRFSYDLAAYTDIGATIAIPLTISFVDRDDPDTSLTCPAFNLQNVSVYVNGEYLARDTEYTIHQVLSEDGNLISNELIIQCMDHFISGQKDICEVIINIAEMEDISSFFVINNELRDSSPVNLYFPNISLAHVNGLLERDASYEGVYMSLPENKYSTGDIFEIQTSLPALVKDFILRYTTNEDLERIKILNDYFYDFHQLIPDILIQEDKHRLYSSFMNTFIHDVITGVIPVTFDPDNTRMDDIISPYLYLQDSDLCFKMLGTNNQLFIDFYPQYINYSVTAEMKRFIDYFVNSYMPENIDPTVEVVYEHG